MFAYSSSYAQDYIFAVNKAGFVEEENPAINTYTVSSSELDYWKIPIHIAMGVNKEELADISLE